MVNAGILIREPGGQRRITGSQTRPQLTADRRTHAVDIVIVIRTGPWRADPKRKIPHRHGILVAMEIHVLKPDVRQNLPVDLRLFHAGERSGVHRLQLQIVVRHGTARNGIIERQIIALRKSLIRPPKSPADILAEPACKNLFPKHHFRHKNITPFGV